MNLNGADINSLLLLKNEDKVVLFRDNCFLFLLKGIIFWCKYDKERHCTKNKSKEKKIKSTVIIVGFTAATNSC